MPMIKYGGGSLMFEAVLLGYMIFYMTHDILSDIN